MENTKVSPATRPIVLYDVSMLFLSAEQVNILILDHKEAACIEVVAYSPTLDVEAPRIYLDFNILNAKISHNVKQREKVNDGIQLPTTDGHLISYITSRLVVPDCTSKQKFIISLAPNIATDVMIDNKLDFEFKSKPTIVRPFETYRLKNQYDSHIHKEYITNEKTAEQSVETFMNYHYDTICNSSAISAFAAILRGQDGKMGPELDRADSNHHVRLNNSELYKVNNVPTDSAAPVNHVKHIKDTLRRAPALHHILGIEQHTLLEAASDTEHRNEEKRLHRLATECVKTYRRSFLNSTINTTVVFDTDKTKGQRAPSVIDEAKLAWLKLFWDSVDMHDDPNGALGTTNTEKKTPTMSGLVNNNKEKEEKEKEKQSPTTASSHHATTHLTQALHGGSRPSTTAVDPDAPTNATPAATSLTFAGILHNNAAPSDNNAMEANVLVTNSQHNITFVHRSSMMVNNNPNNLNITTSSPLSPVGISTLSSESGDYQGLGVKVGSMSSLPPLGMSPTRLNKLPSLFHSESDTVLSLMPLSGRPSSRRDIVTPGLGDAHPIIDREIAQIPIVATSLSNTATPLILETVTPPRRVKNSSPPNVTKTSPEQIRVVQEDTPPSQRSLASDGHQSPYTQQQLQQTVSSYAAQHLDSVVAVSGGDFYGIRSEEMRTLPLIKGAVSADNNNNNNSSSSSSSSSTSRAKISPAKSTSGAHSSHHKSPYLSSIDPSDLVPDKRDTNRKIATHIHSSIRGPTPTHIVSSSRGPSVNSSPYNSAPSSRSVSVANSAANTPLSTPRRSAAVEDPFSTLSMDISTYEYPGLAPLVRTPLGSVNSNGTMGINSSSGSGKGGIASPKRSVLKLAGQNEEENEEEYLDDYEQE